MANRVVQNKDSLSPSSSSSVSPKTRSIISSPLLPLMEEYEFENMLMQCPLRYPMVPKATLPPLPDNVRKIRDGVYVTYHNSPKNKDDSASTRPEMVHVTESEEAVPGPARAVDT